MRPPDSGFSMSHDCVVLGNDAVRRGHSVMSGARAPSAVLPSPGATRWHVTASVFQPKRRGSTLRELVHSPSWPDVGIRATLLVDRQVGVALEERDCGCWREFSAGGERGVF